MDGSNCVKPGSPATTRVLYVYMHPLPSGSIWLRSWPIRARALESPYSGIGLEASKMGPCAYLIETPSGYLSVACEQVPA